MPTTWIITANAGRARIFSQADRKEPLQEIEDMVNSAVHLRASETESDRIGPHATTDTAHNIGSQGAPAQHNSKNAGAPNKTYQPPHTPEEIEAKQFARDLCKYLLDAQREGRYQQLVLSASPHFLGELRNLLDPHVTATIKLELNKDYTQLSGHQLREQLQAQQEKAE